ncbi:PepSY domain-containing protein [Streptomyces sp. NPDC053755]|uniref:PepSY-associated TM helix domain-containing protein n=1 Tax=Streptomyces sp. NPDC053755 TaxID=3155815 RepID=UPI003426439A
MTIDDPARPDTAEPRTTETATGALADPATDPVTGPPTRPAAESGHGSRPRGWNALRPLVLRLHFYAGLLIAPFLLVAATSGMLYALSFQAEKVLYAHELEAPVGERTLPLSQQVHAATKVNPNGTVTAVWPSSEPGATTRVLMADPDVEEGRSLAVFVDPYTGEIRGQLPSYGSSGALPLRTWIDELHRDLHLGDLGRHYSELAASWLWVVALGGLALWIGRRRKNRRALFVPERGPKSRRRTLSWHGTVGLAAVAGLLLLSATGLTWSRYAGENIDMVRAQLGGATPSVSAALDGAASGGSGEHAGHGSGHDAGPARGADVGIDKAVEAARAAGIEGPTSVTLPSEGKGYVVKETDARFPVHLDSVAVDPADGTVIDELRFADYPLLAQATRFGIDAHMGVFLGPFNQLALAALALALIVLIVSGYRMWWLRRPGRPAARGAWRSVPPTMLLPLLAVTALAGWFVPLLGLSLLAFLVADLAAGAVTKVRSRDRDLTREA